MNKPIICEIEAIFSSAMEVMSDNVRNNQCANCSYVNKYGIENSFEVLLVIVPDEQQWELETVMLDAITENEYDRNIVEKSGEFAEQIRNAKWEESEELRKCFSVLTGI